MAKVMAKATAKAKSKTSDPISELPGWTNAQTMATPAIPTSMLSPDQIAQMQHCLEHPLVEVTQSSVKCFMACPQRYVFRYLMGIASRGVSIPLLVGSAVHSGLEQLYPVDTSPGPLDPTAVQERMAWAMAAVRQTFEEYMSSPEYASIQDQLLKGLAQATAIIESFPRMLDQSGWFTTQTEQVVRADPLATLDSPLVDRMAGVLDRVVIPNHAEKQWLVEYKTRASLSGYDWTGNLDLDMQVLWYSLLGTATGLDMEGFFYVVMGKPAHRLSAKGWEELRDRMMAAIANDPEKYFACIPLHINYDAVEIMRQNVKMTVARMDALRAGQVEMHTERCTDYAGCPYKALCAAGANANRPDEVMNLPQLGLYQTVRPHSELSQ